MCLPAAPAWPQVPAGSLPRTMEVILRNDQVPLLSKPLVHKQGPLLQPPQTQAAAHGVCPLLPPPPPPPLAPHAQRAPPAAALQVETVRPGDKAVFTGMLVVVPDVAALT